MNNQAPYYKIVSHEPRPQRWDTFSRKIREERGNTCKVCGKKARLSHHVLEWETYEQFRYEPGNILVLCDRCHSSFSNAEKDGPYSIALSYSRCSPEVRNELSNFLHAKAPEQRELIKALHQGQDYWPEELFR